MSRRHSLAFYSALTTLLLCTIAGIGQPLDRHQKRKPSKEVVDEYLRKDRRLSIHPKQPAKGINTGLVIAYGHPIPPPYVVELREGRLFVNDVQVMPSVIEERSAQREANQRKAILAGPNKNVFESLDKSHHQIIAMARRESSRENILEFAKTQPYMSDVRWGGQRTIEYAMPDGRRGSIDLPVLGVVGSTVTVSEREMSQRVEAAQNDRARTVESLLGRDVCVVFLDGGISGLRRTGKFPAAIPGIMNDTSLSRDDRFRLLYEVVDVPGIVADIMANYSREEWTFRRP